MTPLDFIYAFVVGFNIFALGYVIALNANYLVLMALGWREISQYVQRRPLRDYKKVGESELSLAVSILVPAYNEEPVIVDSVRSLLDLHYKNFEVVVINDGSSDDTIDRLIDEFGLVPVERVPRARIETERIRGVYVSPVEDRLIVIDKQNGGKADSLNAGLRFARYPLFCAVDSDTMLERDALSRLVWQFQLEPETVACGGIVRIVNGSTVEGSELKNVATPKSLVVNLQIVEYLRAFLCGRTGWSKLGALLIISGAFGLFKRQEAVDAGGYDTTTVGEDAELVVRLHRYCREKKRKYKISFIADPVCWTEAPTSLRVLARQRNRWQRGLIEVMSRHSGMIGRRRYGTIGLLAMPYFLVFEALGPLVEVVGYVSMIASVALGWISPGLALAFFALALSFGLIFSFGSLRIEERAFQRYRKRSCMIKLMAAAVIENFGYRQWLTLVRAKAYWTHIRKQKPGWGEMQRSGYDVQPTATATPTPGSEPAGVAPVGV